MANIHCVCGGKQDTYGARWAWEYILYCTLLYTVQYFTVYCTVCIIGIIVAMVYDGMGRRKAEKNTDKDNQGVHS